MAEFITLCVRRRSQRGMHPGVALGGDLVVWFGSTVSIGFLPELAKLTFSTLVERKVDMSIMIFLTFIL
jgi:hypothetical protein